MATAVVAVTAGIHNQQVANDGTNGLLQLAVHVTKCKHVAPLT